MLRVLVGENTVESGFDRAARRGTAVAWVVPKDTAPGDEAVFLFHHSKFVGTGTVLTRPKAGQHGRRAVAFADVGKLKLFPRAVELADVAKAIPEWKWTRYPRSYATPDRAIAAKLTSLIAATGKSLGAPKAAPSKRSRVEPARGSSSEGSGVVNVDAPAADPAATASHWNELIPEEHRQASARALSRSMQAAHAANESCWSLTLSREFVRLNVGVPLALTITADGCTLIVMDDAELLRSFKKARLPVQRGQSFLSAPGTISIGFPLGLLGEIQGRAWQSHVKAMETAATRQPGCPHSGYSVSLVMLLREMGFDVPDSRSPRALQAQKRAPASWRNGAGLEPLVVEPFAPDSVADGRRYVQASIVQRQGQGEFRRTVMYAYGSACAVTGCEVPEVLEAAHIMPYLGDATNHVQNGILLRADLHTLFDVGLLHFDMNWNVRLDDSLKASAYWVFNGMPVRLPTKMALHPSRRALEQANAARRGQGEKS